MTGAGARRAGVLGSPIAHSLSPLLHRTAYAVLGLHDWTYDAYDVNESQLRDFVTHLDDTWAGLSLTMPLKASILPLLASRGRTVEAVGAANTVLPGPAGLRGENTDVAGMVAALQTAGGLDVDEAAVLGGGATARSAIAALAGTCQRVFVYVRSTARHADLVATATAVGVRLGLRDWGHAREALRAGLVVNTTPAGVADELADVVPAQPGVLFEVIYSPWPTQLAARWQESGGQVVGGLELLVQQAVRQVALMTGLAFDEAEMVQHLRIAGAAALAQGRPRED